MRLRRPGVQVFERGSRSTSFFLPDFSLSIGPYCSIMGISRHFEEISFCQVHQSVECLRRVLRYSRLHPRRKMGQTSGRQPNQTHMDVLRLWNPELFKRGYKPRAASTVEQPTQPLSTTIVCITHSASSNCHKFLQRFPARSGKTPVPGSSRCSNIYSLPR
jgi:hypothetical protein